MLAGDAESAAGALGGGPSIYKLQGRNQDLSLATKGNARKQIVSTLKEKMEDGKVWHEYYHKSEPGNKWWFDERSRITTVTELNTALISKYQKVKVRFGYTSRIYIRIYIRLFSQLVPRCTSMLSGSCAHPLVGCTQGKADVRESNHETQQHLAVAQAAVAAAVRSAARTDRLAGGSGGQPTAVAPTSAALVAPPLAVVLAGGDGGSSGGDGSGDGGGDGGGEGGEVGAQAAFSQSVRPPRT